MELTAIDSPSFRGKGNFLHSCKIFIAALSTLEISAFETCEFKTMSPLGKINLRIEVHELSQFNSFEYACSRKYL